MKFMIQKLGYPPHYFECEDDVMVLSRTDIIKILTAQREACINSIEEDEDHCWTAIARERVAKAPLAEDFLDTLTYDG